jgi:hypothetical protein
MFERFIRLMLSADLGDGGGGMTDSAPVDQGTTQDAAAQASAGAAAPAAQAAAPAPQQPQGPDWNSLGVPFDQAQQRLQYYQQLEERYKSDPAWAQKYDQLYGGQQQQQQQHPLSWAKYDDDQQKALREAIKNGSMEDPMAARHSAFMNDFYHNPIGTLPQMLTHPDVVGPVWETMAPQVQDMARRMMEQEMGPIKQYLQQQAQAQFQQQYGKAFESLPQEFRDLHKEGVFGEGPQAIMGAIKAAQKFAAQQRAAAAGGAPAPVPGKPATENKNTATNKPAAPAKSNWSKERDEDEKFAKELAAARGKK